MLLFVGPLFFYDFTLTDWRLLFKRQMQRQTYTFKKQLSSSDQRHGELTLWVLDTQVFEIFLTGKDAFFVRMSDCPVSGIDSQDSLYMSSLDDPS